MGGPNSDQPESLSVQQLVSAPALVRSAQDHLKSAFPQPVMCAFFLVAGARLLHAFT